MQARRVEESRGERKASKKAVFPAQYDCDFTQETGKKGKYKRKYKENTRG